jgi:hypothetical protein
MPDSKVPKQFVEFQRQLVELQKQAFDSTFNALSAMQDQQRALMSRLIEGAPAVPGEMKQLMDEWGKALENGREQFRDSVDRSFETVESYLERLAGEDAPSGGAAKGKGKGKGKGKE